MAVASNLLTKAVSSAMGRIAPKVLAGSWDNTGLLFESPLPPPKKTVLVTIDLTPAVCDEAISLGAGMVVSYHTPMFYGHKSVTLAIPLQATLLRCAAAGISVYSPHSALDSVWGGINDWLASVLLGNKTIDATPGGSADGSVVPIFPPEHESGAEGRRVTLPQPTSMEELVERVKSGLGLSSGEHPSQPFLGHSFVADVGTATVQVGYSPIRADRLVRTIAICAGAGDAMFAGMKERADLYFTGEMPHHEVLATLAKGGHLILCGHTNTERGYLPILADKLRAELAADAEVGDVEVVVSAVDRDPLQVV
ncbi:hypothetical protein HMN09_00360800 [Mycena chlorophos]|uniref:NGG1p interacting factor 3 n=1 Tax=Mycena chlorophos TaxID=658473 RepID=A0A8H6WIU2_MYCCL|nr:hypothetical protein HMN09_00360800 [Mycena chlorophos]